MTDQSIVRQFVPGAELSFRTRIDLFDETLREGAERATISPSVAQKVELAVRISDIGIRSIVLGIFPDTPHNVELLAALLDQQAAGNISRDTRFVVISYLGSRMDRTEQVLRALRRPLDRVSVIGLFAGSDLQVEHFVPLILQQDPASGWRPEIWESIGIKEKRERSLAWLDRYLPSLQGSPAGSVIIGLIDSFRSDIGHLNGTVDLVAKHGLSEVRLIDTAGSCVPQQVMNVIGPLVIKHPNIAFYGHFHDDFGMATGNAVVGLSVGLAGSDVSVGGFANRAGHPPLAEVVLALKILYGVEIGSFQYSKLCELSRHVERVYGLMESPTQAVTGVITHGILSGIRTELQAKAPQIYDVIDPPSVGANLARLFGSRSGPDEVLRVMYEHAAEIGCASGLINHETAHQAFQALAKLWDMRSKEAARSLVGAIETYHRLLRASVLTESEMIQWLRAERPWEMTHV